MIKYSETKPERNILTHIESFWEINIDEPPYSQTPILIIPEAVFDVTFFEKPFVLFNPGTGKYKKFVPGAYFTGLLTESIYLVVQGNTSVFGIRIKPFSLSKIITTPLSVFKNTIVSLNTVFEFINIKDVKAVICEKDYSEKLEYANKFISKIFDKNQNIDSTLRDQLNYIMDSFGNVKISLLYSHFHTNKTSLRDYFLSKVGLPPKELAIIWRLNNFLKLCLENPRENFTSIGLDAGYFDQSHLIKDFKNFFNISPHKFIYSQRTGNIRVIQERIKRRLSSYYSPL
ncbi:MAG: helix-turn-helix domain-containing protein [Bacteroidales bacterium]|nr:helix-turn-helix domain-containing protein [Bacteroidales bacterium]